jgi:hypothetical protein
VKRIKVIRFGNPVEASRNHRDGTLESGMSCYAVEGGVIQFVGWYFGFEVREAWLGTAIQVGTGSDGEPIVADFKGRKISEGKKIALLPEADRNAYLKEWEFARVAWEKRQKKAGKDKAE